MSQGRTAAEISDILQAGGGVILNARSLSPGQLVRLALLAANFGATMILKDTDQLKLDDMISIARAGQGRVIMEIKVSEKENQ